MDTLENFKKAVLYIEENLQGEIDNLKIAQTALCSQYHFQRMFVFLAGVPLSEYIRRRRLTLAAFDLQNSDEKIIDIAAKYGYSSPDTFTRAFQALHKITPSKARAEGVTLKAYPQITFTLSLKGVTEMNYKIEQKPAFTIVGVKERFSHTDNLGASVGKMWAELPQEIYGQIGGFSKEIPPKFVGAYAEMYSDNTTDYYIATITDEKDCPEGLVKLEVPAHTWAVFEITGPLPQSMADIWGRIFSEWFPTSQYEHAKAPEIEWYDTGDMQGENYKSAVWIPVVKK